MKNTIVARPHFLGNLKQRRREPRINPAPSGQSVNIRFPRDTKTLDELDAWLKDHPHAQMVVLGAYPKSRRHQRHLESIRKAHGVGILIKPYLNPKDLL